MRRLTILLALVLVAGCSGLRTTYDYDVEADFTTLSTYTWMEGTVAEGVSELDVRRARSALEEGLAGAGYRYSETDPDFLVALHFATKDRLRITEYDTGYGGRRGYYGGTRRVDVDEYEEGTLVLDVVAPEPRQLLWRGTVTGTVDRSRTPEERTERIRTALRKLLEGFPPSP